jgi:hypothetical protein
MGASAMSLSPSAGAGVTGNDGLVYYNKDAGSLPAGQTFTLSISYEKSSDDLSATSLRVQPAAPVDDTQGETSIQTFLSGALNNKIVAWSLGILGVALIAGGAVWYWQTGKSRQEEQPRRRHRPAVLSEVEEAGGHIYCHQCGKRAGPGDRFCRTCGTKLRSE